MNRREFLGSSVALAASAQATASKPNIIFILTDDLGYGDLGCYGQKKIATPNIDRFAAEGTRFTDAYAGSTVCAPSRCSLMTGKHTGHATIRGNRSPEPGTKPDEAMVAMVLKKAGYRTAMFGKWGLGGPATGSVPNMRGFDEFYGYLNQLHAHNSYPEHLWDNQNEAFLQDNWFDQRKIFAPDRFTAKAVNFVKGPHKAPFFLCFTTTIPHADNERGKFSGNGMEVPDNKQFADKPWPEPEKNFAAMVTRLDSDIGKLMAALKASGEDENTLVIFTSDNGPHREGNHDPDFFESRGPLRGIKRDLYDGGIRVPFIARWPGKVPAGRVSNQVLAFWDFLPTAAEIAGVKAPDNIDGISMLPALLGKPQKNHEYLYWEFHERVFAQAVRMGKWKGVRPGKGKPVELYDVEADLSEKNNLAASNPDVLRRITQLMKQARTEHPDFPA
jgi:arylsulfatase A-like enzyme